jgi:hypothetical protein
MIHLARVLRLGCGAGMGASWRVMLGSLLARCGTASAGAGQQLGLPDVTTC